MEKLSVKGMALALGITWALCVVLLGIAGMFGWGIGVVAALGTLYIGYEATFLGLIIGAVWGFIDCAIGGAIIAFLYNKLA